MIQKILGPHWRTTLGAIGVAIGTGGYMIQTELAGAHLTFVGVCKVVVGLATTYGLWQAKDAKGPNY